MLSEIREIEDQFYCQKRGQFIQEPVILITGHTYKKQAILKFFEEHGPKDLRSSGMTPNRALKGLIAEFKSRKIVRQPIPTQKNLVLVPLNIYTGCYDDVLKSLKDKSASLLTNDLKISYLSWTDEVSKINIRKEPMYQI